jgi:hypothetical protein
MKSSQSSNSRINAYAKDGRGHDFTSSYKYASTPSTGTSTASKPISIPTFTRSIYAKDARGVELSPDSSFSSITSEEEQGILANKMSSTPIVGDDGLFRGPYDLGQRERTLGYWAELRSSASSLRSSSVSLRSFRSSK